MKGKYIFGTLLGVLLVAALSISMAAARPLRGSLRSKALPHKTLADIKNQFNLAKDDVRVLLLLSPT